MTDNLILVLSVTMTILAVVAVIGNSLVIAAICRNRRLYTPSNIFIMILANVDIFCALTTLLKFIVLHFDMSLSHMTCAVVVSLGTMGCNTNLWMIYIVSMDRLVAIYRPLKYRTWISKARAVRIGVAGLTMSVLLEVCAVASFIDWTKKGRCTIELVITPSLTISMTVFTAVVTVQLLVMYAAMFRKALAHQNGKVAQNGKAVKLLDIKALKTCVFVLGSLLVTWIPRLVFFNLVAFTTDHTFFLHLGSLGAIFPVINATLDPVVYSILRTDIRAGVIRLFNPHTRTKELPMQTVSTSVTRNDFSGLQLNTLIDSIGV